MKDKKPVIVLIIISIIISIIIILIVISIIISNFGYALIYIIVFTSPCVIIIYYICKKDKEKQKKITLEHELYLKQEVNREIEDHRKELEIELIFREQIKNEKEIKQKMCYKSHHEKQI